MTNWKTLCRGALVAALVGWAMAMALADPASADELRTAAARDDVAAVKRLIAAGHPLGVKLHIKTKSNRTQIDLGEPASSAARATRGHQKTVGQA